jgi:hypothetical protein
MFQKRQIAAPFFKAFIPSQWRDRAGFSPASLNFPLTLQAKSAGHPDAVSLKELSAREIQFHAENAPDVITHLSEMSKGAADTHTRLPARREGINRQFTQNITEKRASGFYLFGFSF